MCILFQVPGQLHGLLCNDPALMCELSLQWMREMASSADTTSTAVVPDSTDGANVTVDGIGAGDTARGYTAVGDRDGEGDRC
jgi:hypothetical protein